MFAFFLNILRQKSGRYVCVQLLQTLNILFENISHETSLCKYLKVKYTYIFYTIQWNQRYSSNMLVISGVVESIVVIYNSLLKVTKIHPFFLLRLPFVQQPRQLNNRAQV